MGPNVAWWIGRSERGGPFHASKGVIIATWTIIAAALLLSFVAYVFVSIWLARRFSLETDGVETVTIELPTIGHHIALFHYKPDLQRYREPVIVCHGLGANRFNMDFAWDATGESCAVGGGASPPAARTGALPVQYRLSLARTLARKGFDVWSLELRGRGRANVPRRATWCVDDEVREDVPHAIQTVLDLSGADRVFWVGHSKGGILQYLLHAERLPEAEKVAGFVAIGSPGTFKYQQRKLGAIVALGAQLARLGRPIPLSLISKLGIPIAELVTAAARVTVPIGAMDAPVLRRVMASLTADISPGVMTQFADWFRGEGAITRCDGHRYEEGFKNITVPVFLIAGAKDELAPPAAVEHVRDRVGSKDVTYTVLPGYGHGDLVIGARAPDDVFPVVIEWLEKRASASEDVKTTSTERPEADG